MDCAADALAAHAPAILADTVGAIGTGATVVGVLIGVLSAIATVVVAWATLRADARHDREQLDELKRDRSDDERRIASLERWRERVRGAERERHRTKAAESTRDDDG